MPENKRTVLFNTGLLYYKINDFDKALEYDLKTLELLRLANVRDEVDQLLLNISLCYIGKDDFEKGEYYLNQARLECGHNCAPYIQLQVLFNYGMLYQGQKKYSQAESAFLKSLSESITQHNTRFSLDNIQRLCEIYTTQKRYAESRQLLTIADTLLPKVHLNLEAEQIYLQHIHLCRALRDIPGLAYYQEKYLQTHDSLFTRKLSIALTQAEGDHQRREAAATLKNHKEAIVLRDKLIYSQRILIALSLVTAISLILLLTISIKRSRSRKNANLLLEEKVKARTSDYAASLSKLTLAFKSEREMMGKLLTETSNAMAAVNVLSIMLQQDSENNSLYVADIKKLSLKVSEAIEEFQKVSSDSFHHK
jgi:tetratricopeptide (TPR) repeat protein